MNNYTTTHTMVLFEMHSQAENTIGHILRTQKRYPDSMTEGMATKLREKQWEAAEIWHELSNRLDQVPSADLYMAIDGNVKLRIL